MRPRHRCGPPGGGRRTRTQPPLPSGTRFSCSWILLGGKRALSMRIEAANTAHRGACQGNLVPEGRGPGCPAAAAHARHFAPNCDVLGLRSACGRRERPATHEEDDHAQYLFPLYHGGQGVATPLNQAQERLSDQMVSYWTRFAETGNPSSHDAPDWPRYKMQNEWLQSLRLPNAVTISAEEFAYDHKCDLWDALE